MHPIALERIDFPTPVIQLAVEPKTKADQEKMGMAIAKLAQEDPTFRVNTDPETGQTILSGMGELHLEIIVDRMMREFGVGGQRRQAAGGVSRNHPPDGGIRLHAQEADWWQRPIRPHQATRRAESRARATSSKTRSAAAIFPRNSFRPWKRAWWKRSKAASSPASRWSMSK